MSASIDYPILVGGMPKVAKAQMFGQPAASIVVMVNGFKVRWKTTLQCKIHHHTGLPDCMGPVCAYDAPVIEMIAKPALPSDGFGDTV